MMYDELIKRLRDCTAEHNGEKTLWCQAADAIEELRMKLHGDEAAIVGMKREIERMVVSNTLNKDCSYRKYCPYWFEDGGFCSMLGKCVAEPPKEET